MKRLISLEIGQATPMLHMNTESKTGRLITVLKVTGQVAAGCLVAFILYCVQSAILGAGSESLSMMNPLISGYLHASLAHFFTNLLILYLCLLPRINHPYQFKQIFYITTILSLVYLPISATGLTQPAIGLSGACYYLASRYFLSRATYYRLGRIILLILVVAEMYGLSQPADGVAHIMHILGIILGILSFRANSHKTNYHIAHSHPRSIL